MKPGSTERACRRRCAAWTARPSRAMAARCADRQDAVRRPARRRRRAASSGIHGQDPGILDDDVGFRHSRSASTFIATRLAGSQVVKYRTAQQRRRGVRTRKGNGQAGSEEHAGACRDKGQARRDRSQGHRQDVRSRAQTPLRALDNVSVAIRENEFFTLLGPSGCGKTTLLRLIAGFEYPTGARSCSTARTSPACRPSGGRSTPCSRATRCSRT